MAIKNLKIINYILAENWETNNTCKIQTLDELLESLTREELIYTVKKLVEK